MVILTKEDAFSNDRRSSKGNQLKWKKENIWYKADYLGYEGLSEYVVSYLLQKSTLKAGEYLLYDPEQISYEKSVFNGVRSVDFIPEGYSLITLERHIKLTLGQSLNSVIYQTEDHMERLKILVSLVERTTGIRDFGIYMSKILTVDSLFLNEDRHTHNIAVLTNKSDDFMLCPIFDQGAALLSDTSLDYPLGEDIYGLIETCHSKTFCRDFSEQLDICEKLYGENIRFSFTHKDVEDALLTVDDDMYAAEIKDRVRDVLFEQMRKYSYLFRQ